MSQGSSCSYLMLHRRSAWTSPEEEKGPSPGLQRCYPDSNSMEHLSFHFWQRSQGIRLMTAHFRSSMETPYLCLPGAGTLREVLRMCPYSGAIIIHGVPTSSREQGQSWDSLCLNSVTSWEFQPHIPVQGSGRQLEHYCQCSSVTPVGKLAISLLPAAQERARE